MDKQFKKIVESVFKRKVNENMNINNTPEWDSLNFLRLISSLEKVYKKKLRMINLKNVQTLKIFLIYLKNK